MSLSFFNTSSICFLSSSIVVSDFYYSINGPINLLTISVISNNLEDGFLVNLIVLGFNSLAAINALETKK